MNYAKLAVSFSVPHEADDNNQGDGLKNNPVAHDTVRIFNIIITTARHCHHAPAKNDQSTCYSGSLDITKLGY